MAQPHDIADDFGDGTVMILRNFLTEIDRGVQGADEGGFSTTGMPWASGTSRILRAIRSVPLARQTAKPRQSASDW
jgi:hypothetical protein